MKNIINNNLTVVANSITSKVSHFFVTIAEGSGSEYCARTAPENHNMCNYTIQLYDMTGVELKEIHVADLGWSRNMPYQYAFKRWSPHRTDEQLVIDMVREYMGHYDEADTHPDVYLPSLSGKCSLHENGEYWDVYKGNKQACQLNADYTDNTTNWRGWSARQWYRDVLPTLMGYGFSKPQAQKVLRCLSKMYDQDRKWVWEQMHIVPTYLELPISKQSWAKIAKGYSWNDVMHMADSHGADLKHMSHPRATTIALFMSKLVDPSVTSAYCPKPVKQTQTPPPPMTYSLGDVFAQL